MVAPTKVVPPVDERIEAMKRSLEIHKAEAEKIVPGLLKLLADYLDPNVEVNSADFAAALFKALRFSKDEGVRKAYEDAVNGYTQHEQKQLEMFAHGGSANEIGMEFKQGVSAKTRQEMRDMQGAPEVKEYRIADVVQGRMKPIGILEEAKDWFKELTGQESSRAFENAPFENWGQTVNNTPLFTFVPKTVKEIQSIVRFAKEKGMSVRCAGYRHSWPPIFSADKQILISMLDLERVEKTPDLTSLGFYDVWGTQDEPLQSIQFVDKVFDKNNQKRVRIGTAVTHETMRRWCIANDVAIPSNTVIVEITMGGSNGTMCHGAGINNKTLSDLVTAIEYVDAHGKRQMLDDPESLRAAAGCFGLIGVVTHLTLRLDKLRIAKMQPLKAPAAFIVPPLDDVLEKAPATMQHLIKPWMELSPEDKKKKIAEFEDHCEHDYYAEFFWFPLSDYSWRNCWNTTSNEAEIRQAVEYPSPAKVFLQFVEALTQNVLQNNEALNTIIKLFDIEQPITTIRSRLAMSQLPEETILTPVPDAIHFQRALQNIGGIRDMELEIPLQPRKDDPKRPDFDLVRRAWWDAILQVYEPENLKTVPMDLTLEMRMTGGSDLIMAAQRHSNLGCCSIECIALLDTPESFPAFAQQITDTWTSYVDAAGHKLKTRPHWGKEWYPYKVNGKPWLEHMKTDLYKDDIAEFKQTLSAIGAKQGWTLNDVQRTFSNELLDELIFAEP